MGSLTRGLSDDIKSLNAEPILGVLDDELLSVSLNRIAKHVDSPLRMFASATPDALLNISANIVEVGDGAAKITPATDGSIGSFPATTINMQTGAVTGGTVKLSSESPFSLPAGTLNFYRRMCLSLSGSTLYAAFSPEAATVGALEDPGVTFTNLLGLPAGFITLQVTDISGKYKTANSLTNVIENKVGSTPVIMRFGAGGGGSGAGGDESFKIRTVVTDGTTTIKGGSIALSDGKVISTYSGSGTTESSFNQNIVFDLDTLQPAAVNNTTYYLYVDLDSLTPTTLTDTGRVVYGVTSAKLVLLTSSPETVDRVRYAAIGSVRRATGSWSSTGITYPPKRAISDAPGDNSFKPMLVNNITVGGGSLADMNTTIGATITPGFDTTARIGVKINSGSVGGRLSTVQFYIRRGPSSSGNVFAELRQVVGGNPTTLLATSTLVPATALPVGSSGWVTFTFPTTPIINGGTDYAFVLGRDDANNLTYHNMSDNPLTTYVQYVSGSWSELVAVGFSFNATIVGVDASTFVINRGSLLLADSREIYSATDISVPLSSYTSDGNYYIYLDMLTLPAPTLVNGRAVSLVTSANFVLMTTVPSATNRSRYMPAGFITKATTWQTPIPIIPRSYSFGIDSSNYQEYAPLPQAIGAVGSSGQLVAGHELLAGSFPSAAQASTSFYNLAGLLDANTSLAHNLSNVGTALFTGTGILGLPNTCVALNGTSQYLNSTDTHFDPGDTDFTVGGWIKANDLSATKPLCSQAIGGAQSFLVAITSTDVVLEGSVDSLNMQQQFFPMSFYTGTWYHIVVKYVASTNTFHVYVNGTKLGTHTLTGNLVAAGSSRNFQVGAQSIVGRYLAGNIDEFFFCNGTAFTDEAISKIYSYKLTHGKYITPSSQSWMIHAAYNGTTREISNSVIVTKDYNDLYIDLTGYDPTTVLTIAMESTGAFGTAVPANARMLEGTAAEVDAMINGSGINFYFPSMITAVELWVESDTANLFERHPNVSNYFLSESVSPYRLMFNVDTLTSVLGGTKKVKLIVSTGNQSLAVNPYIFTPVSRSTSFLSYPFEVNLVDTTSGPLTATLPSSPRAGDEIRFVDAKNKFALNNLTLARNGKLIGGVASNYYCTLPNTVYTAVFTGDAYGWVVSSGSEVSYLRVTPVTGAYTILSTDVIVRATGGSTYAVTLPLATAANTGQEYTIKSAMNAGVALTVNTTSSQTIDGVTSVSLARFESLRVVSNGSGWDIISDKVAAVYG
jgi:hypothetical protein